MKPKIAILVALVVVIAGYLAYDNFFKGAAMDDEKNVRASFDTMTRAIASGDRNKALSLLSPTFSDKQIKRKDFVKILTAKRVSYNAVIQSVATQGDLASITYTRTETRSKDSEPIQAEIVGETWVRDIANPAVWKLQKLAPNDKWFRTLETPKKEAKAQKEEAKPVLGTLEAGVTPVALTKGARYSPAGKRDPFKSLVAVEEGAGEEGRDVCDPDRPRELLEAYDLMSLKLAGVIMRDDKGPVALVEAPDGKGYTLTKGMYLGKRCGKIIEIYSDYLLVSEQVRKPGVRAGFETVETPLKLRPEEG